MTELFIAANVLMLACLAESVFGMNLLLRTICGGLTSVLSGASAGLLVYLYGISGGPDAGRSFLQLYLPVAAYASSSSAEPFCCSRARRCARRSDISEKCGTGPVEIPPGRFAYRIIHMRPPLPSFTMRCMVQRSLFCTLGGMRLILDSSPSSAMS